MFQIKHYTDWNASRINAILDYYGKDFFKGKKILEVGCGWADVGSYFDSIGADVTVSDARQEHIDVVKSKHPNLKARMINSQETDWKYEETKYDVIIHFGLLYHLKNPAENLKMICRHCDTLIIQSEVLDSDDPDRVILKNEQTSWDKGAWGMAYSGTGCLPSYAYVEYQLKKNNMQVNRMPRPSLRNSGAHKYDWPRVNANVFVSAQRSMWFCKKI